MKKLEKYLNNGREDLRLWQKNWFFAATLFVVVLNIVLFAALGGKWHIDTDNLYSASDNAQGLYGVKSHWNDCLYFKSLLQVFLSAFSHFNWQHTLLNMLCFLVCGIYLERKIGSVKLVSLVACFAFFCNSAVAANNDSINFYGFSCVNYAIYAYILVDYIFCALSKNTRNKLNVIYGGIMLGLIYFSACFNGGTQNVSFTWYPYDAFHNLGHYTGYFTGLIISTFLCGTQYLAERRKRVAKCLSAIEGITHD